MRSVLLLGIPRCGTTWIGQVLGRTSGAVYVHEPDGVNDSFAFRAQQRDGIPPFPILSAGDLAPEYHRLWEGALAGGEHARTMRAALARRAYRRASEGDKLAARATGKLTLPLRTAETLAVPRVASSATAVVVKSVNAALAAEWIWDAFRPSILVVRRDLRNVVASWLTMDFGAPRPEIYRSLARESIRRWNVELPDDDDPTMRVTAFCAMSMLALHEGLRAHPEWSVVSHDDACADGSSQLSTAARHLGLEWSDEAEEFLRASNRPGSGYATTRVVSELPDQWRRRLSTEQAASITSILERFPDDLWRAPDHR